MRHILTFFLSLAMLTAVAQTPQSTSYQYDALGRLTKVIYPSGSSITYNYDVLGNRTSVVTTAVSCPPTITHGTGVLAAGTYQAGQTISSQANVSTPTTYKAGQSILLTNGFQAGPNEVFEAKIEGCPTATSVGSVIKQDK